MWKTGWTTAWRTECYEAFFSQLITYSDRQYPCFYWIWNFITFFPEVRQCVLSCYRCIQPLTSHPVTYMCTFLLFWSLLFLRLKFPTSFSSNPFELYGLSFLSWFIHHINARHEIQVLNFLISLLFLFLGLYIQVFTWTLCPQTLSGSETARTEALLPDSRVGASNVPLIALYLPAFFP
jgi:uncharacterized membrane protein